MRQVAVIDSHTANEPTRVVLNDFFPGSADTLAERRAQLAANHEQWCRPLVDEPRGHKGMVAAVLVPPEQERSVTGVIFFDRSAMLGMCGHGTIGVVETLRHLGRIGPGVHTIDTPVGSVTAVLHPDGLVALTNVVSRRLHADVALHIPGLGAVIGDIAYGGNTFFSLRTPEIDLDLPSRELIGICTSLLEAVHRAGHPGVDHIELSGPATVEGAHSRNFVLCPSGTYDRSPCGTGTSAKLAVLAAQGELAPGECWTQESITGSTFDLQYQWAAEPGGAIVPTISARAELIAEATLFLP